jgi:hypothetical protein
MVGGIIILLNENEEILLLKAQNKKLKDIIEYLDSKNKKYEEYLKILKVKIETIEIKNNFLPSEFKYGIDYNYITYHRITMPEIIIGHKGRQQNLIREINKVLES